MTVWIARIYMIYSRIERMTTQSTFLRRTVIRIESQKNMG